MRKSFFGGSSVIFLNVLLTCLLSGILVAQTLPTPSLPTTTSNWLPSWLKEGVCVVYQMEGGSRVGIGAESSSVYTRGYIVYVILAIQDRVPYGLEISYFRDMRGSYSIKQDVKALDARRTFLYIDPNDVRQFLSERQLQAQYGIVVEGGPLPDGTFYFATTRRSQDEITTQSFVYTADGAIKVASITKQHANGADAGKLTLVGIYQTNLPKLTLPSVARESPTYVLAYQNLFGQLEPWAYSKVTSAQVDRSVVRYSVTASGRVSRNYEVVGTPLFGPFYINPELLKNQMIVSVPDIGFSFRVTGTGPNGGSLVTIFFENQPAAHMEYDTRTGLLLLHEFMEISFRGVIMLVDR